MLDTSDTQVYVFVFCFWKGKDTGRTVIMIKEELCPQIRSMFSCTTLISQNQDICLCIEEVCDCLVILYPGKSAAFAEENAVIHLHETNKLSYHLYYIV